VKNIYADTSMFPVAGEDAGNTAYDYDNYPDISESDVDLSYNFVDNNNDPKPELFYDYLESLPFTNHGNACVGVIGAVRSNDSCTLCGCGVAYHSKMAALKAGHIRKFHWEKYPQMNASSFSAALGYKYQNIQIYSNSWTFVKPFARMEPFTARVVERSILQGRGGLGSIFVFPAGMPGNGFAQNIHTISVNSIGKNGKVPPSVFANSATLLTVTHTTRRLGDRKCDNKFGGSSAATAIISEIIALALQAK
ncbi:FURI1-like protein, partial [Mya arenaria]